jgi:DNA-directed RNA polymerase specialized sigma24 family protein
MAIITREPEREQRWMEPKRWGMLFPNRNEEEEMAQPRLSMRRIDEILRLNYEAGLSHRKIAAACGISAGSVSEYVARAKAPGSAGCCRTG